MNGNVTNTKCKHLHTFIAVTFHNERLVHRNH